ncbi:MAG: arylsulfatase [Luteolibacter sp.]
MKPKKRRITRSLSSAAIAAFFSVVSACYVSAAAQPNVILIMTDDQGYGDVGVHGNPILKTPELDRLHGESVRLTDYHVSPFCTPTRAALMTGHYPGRTGAYRTSSGRTMLHTDEKTVANLFADNGYVTGMMGKWHLGDNAPHRPQDRGFQDVVWHRCGGVGQASDHWGNDYFDDIYERVRPGSKEGEFEQFSGYCTDVFFEESLRFIKENKDKPFFLYLATNAPHGPYLVGDEWKAPYQGKVTPPVDAFYGMIANFDHNVGVLRKELEALGLAENTILIFTTDNGSAAGDKVFNAGMKGKKSTIWDGGHRVPFFIRWPKGGLEGGRDLTSLAAHIDVLPTLAELCGLPVPEKLDGISFQPILEDSSATPARDHVIVQYHGGAGFTGVAKQWENSCIIKDQWRLMDGAALYDIKADPAQTTDVAAEHPEVVASLRTLYPSFWESVSPRMTPVSIDLGEPTDNPTVLCSQDWYMPKGNPPWNFGSIRTLPRVTGPWMVDVKKAGTYRITLRQYPEEAEKPVVAERAMLEIAGITKESAVEPGSMGVVFELELPAGKTELVTYLYDKNGKAGGAYFTEVEML